MAKRPRTPTPPAPYPPGWEPFLDAIRSDVEDDTARLVFADWLQENGDEEWAEFIRIQCALDHSDFAREREADRLLIANRSRWLRGLPRWVSANPNKHLFRRGLVATISTSGERYADTAEAFGRLTALESLALDDITFQSGIRLAGCVFPASLRHLTLSGAWGGPAGEAVVRAVLCVPSLCGLSRLTLQNMPVGNEAVTYLSELTWKNFRSLALRDTHFDRTGAERLGRAPFA